MLSLLILLVAIGSFIFAAVLFRRSREHSAHLNLLRRAVSAKMGDLKNTGPGQIVAVSGTAGTEQPLVSFQSKTPCIYYDYDVIRRFRTRQWKRREDGQSRSTLVSDSETVAQEQESTPFHLRDDSGQIAVNPEGARFESVTVMDRVEPATDKNAKGLPGQRMDLSKGLGHTVEYVVRENAIPIAKPIYVVGPVSENGRIEPTNRDHVIISHRPVSELQEEWTSHSRARSLGCFGALAFSVLALVAGTVLNAM